MQTRRERAKENIREEIKAVARGQMAASGTAGLSLRAIAREMELTAPALYRYFPRLDDLVTALIVDAFTGLAHAAETADAAQQPDDYAGRLRASMRAYRGWANAHPIDFQLIYGNPIPGYEAPREVTVPAAARSLTTFGKILFEAYQAGKLNLPPRFHNPPPTMRETMQQIEDEYQVPIPVFYLSHVGWSRMHGVIMLEILGHIQPTIGDVDAYFETEIDSMLAEGGVS